MYMIWLNLGWYQSPPVGGYQPAFPAVRMEKQHVMALMRGLMLELEPVTSLAEDLLAEGRHVTSLAADLFVEGRHVMSLAADLVVLHQRWRCSHLELTLHPWLLKEIRV